MNAQKSAFRNFLYGGILPILAFVVVEQIYGVKGGVIAGLIFCTGEILWEMKKNGKVRGITIFSSALILLLGGLSLLEGDGIFFKLQPAIFLAVFSVVFFFSSLLGRPFLVELSRKQNPELPLEFIDKLRGMNYRVGILFFMLAGLSAYSAFYWSSTAWATLKAVGLPVAMVFYFLMEMAWIRFSRRRPPSSR